MKKMFFLIALPALLFGCAKSGNTSQACTDVTPASEEAQIIAYCNANNISYTKDSSGIFYQIIDQGTAPHATISSTVSTTYVGKYLTGSVIDQSTTPYTAPLNKLIPGWQIGLQLIGKGGHIKMVVPSSLCYGCYGVPASGLPPNTIIFFDINLLDVK